MPDEALSSHNENDDDDDDDDDDDYTYPIERSGVCIAQCQCKVPQLRPVLGVLSPTGENPSQIQSAHSGMNYSLLTCYSNAHQHQNQPPITLHRNLDPFFCGGQSYTQRFAGRLFAEQAQGGLIYHLVIAHS